ncbi:MAG: Glu-tRNA(Gln) amidotransferase GatDE subunit E, partial [Haloferacaceae archaeon]
AEQVAYGERMPTFEAAVERGVDPTVAATTLASTLTELRRDGVPVGAVDEGALLDLLELVADGDLPKEGIEEALTTLAENPDLTAAAAVEAAGLGGASESEVRETVREVVERNEAQVREEGMGAFSALMGECMGALRGKAEGDVVSDVLREEIQRLAEA